MSSQNLSLRGVYRKLVPRSARRFAKENLSRLSRNIFFRDLITHTDNFGGVTWLGYPIWQNVMDLWTIQETISEIKPGLLIECGTYQGGSALFYANLFDLMGQGRVVTVDIERRHDIQHPRITFLSGSSVAPEILSQMRAAAAASPGPVMVILDSCHDESHVALELEAYSSLVTPGSFLLCQDGVVDLDERWEGLRPGPLPAIEAFLARRPDFVLDVARCDRFLITHHPKGWMRRRAEETPPVRDDRHEQETGAMKVGAGVR
jgi:cephalosporin hydroxylase